ncbi:hypothetical protein PSTT_10851 [Puccinia striiformis]|uniref:Uncharacterized protein n=1 Tax=Puccinia striiformis TaxID=27350 RepID=A0A2S4V2R3_9BASI|nr:hypothetical protein PSTT_10851 [Puccinia striiformis]
MDMYFNVLVRLALLGLFTTLYGVLKLQPVVVRPLSLRVSPATHTWIPPIAPV